MDDELDEIVASMQPRLRLPKWLAMLLAPLCAVLGAVGGMYGAGLFAIAVFGLGKHGGLDAWVVAPFGVAGLVGGLVAGITVGAGVLVPWSMGEPMRRRVVLPWIAGAIAFALGAPMLLFSML
jgi:hypothetical protein